MKETTPKKRDLTQYRPLFVLVLIAVFAAYVLNLSHENDFYSWMHYFMGFFFSQFAMLKLFQPRGFAEGFRKYDLLATRFPFYGSVYPYIELGLGLCYLSFFGGKITYLITVIVMTVGAIGVIRALRKGLDLRCACMGTVLNVPLSTVTLTEDLVMGAMALWMLF